MNSVFIRSFPNSRLRRIRSNKFSRYICSENIVTIKDLIYPVFVIEGLNKKQKINAMPGIYRMTIDCLLKEAEKLAKLGILMLSIFPVIEKDKKSYYAEESYNPNGLVQRTIKSLKKEVPEIGLMTDIALDSYTVHGHDGVIDDNGYVLNECTKKILIKQALSHVESGVEIIAPSDMMDGRIGDIRNKLEAKGYLNIQIMSYAAKYASCYYQPFRSAIGSIDNLNKKKKNTYQMDPANSDEALQEVAQDIYEGADMIMIKPGMPYLDIIYRVKKKFKIPTFAYQVSGEYSMHMAAIKNGWISEKMSIMESLLCFKRAGVNGILTYFSKKVAQWLYNEKYHI